MDLINVTGGQRIVCWFSHGAASAVAAKLAIEDNDKSVNPKELVVVSIFIEEEHEDNVRFKAECEKWLGQEIITIKDKQQCFTMLEEAGISLPEMYHLGYPNNNCKGCLKVTSLGYWNKTRVDFPELFSERAEQERLLGVALCKMSGKKFEKLHPEHYDIMKRDHEAGLVKWSVDNRGGLRIPLRYLPPDAGVLEPIYVPDCGFFCESEKD